MLSLRPIKYNIAIGVGYIIAGISVFALARNGGYISPIWPSAGIALAAMMLFGKEVWPGIVIGSFLVNYGYGDFRSPVIVCTVIAGAAGLQAWLGQHLLKRQITTRYNFNDQGQIIRFILFGAILSTITSATLSCGVLFISGNMPLTALPANWLIWWLGDCFGILLATPMMISICSAQSRHWHNRVVVINIAFVVMLIITVIVFMLARSHDQQRQQNLINQQFLGLKNALTIHISSHINALHSIAALLPVGDPLTEPQFKTFIEHIFTSNTGFQAISWDPIIKGSELKYYQDQQSARLGSQLVINEFDVNHQLVPVMPRALHVIVQSVFPSANNQRIIGYDVYSEPIRKSAIDAAMQSKVLSATDPINLIQAGHQQPAMLLFLPHFNHSEMDGFVTGVLHLKQFISTAFAHIDTDNLHIALQLATAAQNPPVQQNHFYDQGDPSQTTVQHAITDAMPNAFKRQASFSIGDKTLSLVVQPNAFWISNKASQLPWLLLLFCLFLTIVIGYQILMVTGKHNIIHRLSQKQEQVNQALLQSNNNLNHALQRLMETQKKLLEQEKFAALGQLVAGLAHEINTPVGISVTAASTLTETIRHLLDLTHSGGLKKTVLLEKLTQAQDTAQLINSSNIKAALLINRFKQLSIDKDSEIRSVFALDNLLTTLFNTYSATLNHHQHHITLHCPTIIIDSFAGLMTFLFDYLINNSLEHGFNEMNNGQITIDIQLTDQSLDIRYIDNGSGMDDNTVAHIFDPFYTTKRQEGAVGLGGTIFFNIVSQILNGSVECHSQLGQGEQVNISLPLPNDAITVIRRCNDTK